MIGILERNTQNLAHIDLFSKLMSERILFINEVIDDYVTAMVQAQLLYLASISQDMITIYVNSPGGSVYAGLGITDTMDLIKSKGITIKTVCTGMSASMAAVILSNGTKGYRFALKHSRTMIHQPMGGASGQVSDIKITYQEIEKLRVELYQILVDNTKQSFETIEKDCDRDYWFRAEEAIEYGLIDHILV